MSATQPIDVDDDEFEGQEGVLPYGDGLRRPARVVVPRG